MNSKAKQWSRVLLSLLLVTGFVSSVSDLHAQGRVANYTTTNLGTGYTPLSGGTLIMGGNSDDVTASVALPFAFNFDNTTYASGSTIRVNSNGWVEFGTSVQPGGSPYADRVSPAYTYPSTIYVWSNDCYVYTGIYTQVLGVAPNRVFVIEFVNLQSYKSGNQTSMQVQLQETSYVIELHYKDPGMTMGRSHSVGLHGGASPSFSSLRVYGGSYNIPSTNYRLTPPIPPGQQLSVSPKSINFGSLVAGEISPTFTVTVRNAGITTNLSVNSAAISGHPDFTIVSSPPSNVYPPGASGTYTLRFSPQASGNRTASFTINSNGIDSGSQSVTLTGFGFAPQVEFEAATQIFRKTRTLLGESISHSTVIKSTGNGPLKITGAIITGEYANNYQITRMPAEMIPAGTSDTLTVTYLPREEGLRIAQLEITTNSIKSPNKTITMYGLGILPRLTITPRNVTFDSIAVGDTAYATVRLENPGSDTLALISNYLTFADPDFTYMGLEGSDSLIAPERFREVQVRFIPRTRGHREARLRYLTNIPRTFEDVQRDTSEFIVDVVGVAVPYGLLSIDAPTTIDSAVIGTEVCRNIPIMNNGESPLMINSITVMGQDAADFMINPALPLVIPAEGSVQVRVCATPSVRGLRTATVEVNATSNGKSSNTQFPLAVFGIAVCAETDKATAFAEEIVRINENKTTTIVVTNCGDVASHYTAVVAGTGYTLVGNAQSGMIAPGATTSYNVSFAPGQRTLHAGTLTISAEGLTPLVVDLAGVGGNSILQASNTVAQPTALGAKSTFDVTVTNSGNMEWNVGLPNVTVGEFKLLDPIPTTIAANGGTGTFSFEFEPRLGSQRKATVSFPASDNTSFQFEITGTLASVRPTVANGYILGQNYPNPVVGSSTIAFTMAKAGHARIVISDLTGNVAAVVAEGFYAEGVHEVKFDLSNLASGNYFYELEANGVRLQRSMILNK